MTASRTPALSQRRSLWFAGCVALCLAVFFRPLWELLRLSLNADTYSHILLVPFVPIGLALIRPRRLGDLAKPSPGGAAAVFLAGAVVLGVNWRFGSQLPAGSSLALNILSLLCLVWSAFLLIYGARAFHSLLFPLLFLLLAVPLPQVLIDHCISWLQDGSAAVTYGLFHLTGTPVFRDGNIFVVPQVTIEIAKECSGIRSAVALLITCLLAGYLFLRSNWARVVLLAAAVPVLVIKNGVRIVTLTLLAIHVDPGFLHGRLHREGGFLFFLVGLVILWPVLWWLQRMEAKHGHEHGARGSP
jgi:exosortase